MFAQRWVQFEDITTPLELRSGPELLAVLADVLPSWRFAEVACAPAGSKAPIVIEQVGPDFILSSRWLATPERRDDPVNIACALVIELVWAYLEDHPDKLCLHGAAAEFAGRLVIFPNRYRAGKSLLSGCLAMAGKRIFTDDILPVDVADGGLISGVATGVAPRLRLPLPDNLCDAAKAFLSERAGPQSHHYRYLALGGDLQAQRSESLPIGAFVFLERRDEGPASLEEVGEAEMLREVVWQNFARQQPSGAILNVLQRLVAQAGRFRVRYARAEDAAELLSAHFAEWHGPVPRLSDGAAPVRKVKAAGVPHRAGAYRQRDGVYEHAAGDEHFLADSSGAEIHHLNPTAATVWRLLAEPMTRHEIVELFQAAFPDQSRQQIEGDIGRLLKELSAKDLLEYTAGCRQPGDEILEARA